MSVSTKKLKCPYCGRMLKASENLCACGAYRADPDDPNKRYKEIDYDS